MTFFSLQGLLVVRGEGHLELFNVNDSIIISIKSLERKYDVLVSEHLLVINGSC